MKLDSLYRARFYQFIISNPDTDELKKIKVELIAFIEYVKSNIDSNKLYLLHIFKDFNSLKGKTGGGVPPANHYSFSLQKGQVELNEVSTELYGYNKRGSKLCNILCKYFM